MIERRFIWFVVGMMVFIPAELLVDRDGLAAQLVFCAVTFAFVFAFTRRSSVPRIQILCAVLVATLAEMFLSLAWGLYSYKHFIIPLYVPPGHGLFYALAADTALQPGLRRHEALIVRRVFAIGTLIALVSLVAFHDTWGCFWWIVVLMMIRSSRNGLMLAACYVYTTYLEWVGTAIGNWRWNPYVPFVGLHSANPPAGVGILYILLDLIVVSLTVRALDEHLIAAPAADPDVSVA
ncbi:MAG TPA: hypothetical protein VEU08_06155 [Vicinamibacterales bacterium]|nr:hypothetical protein [Vicinamibacterales bacterium]